MHLKQRNIMNNYLKIHVCMFVCMYECVKLHLLAFSIYILRVVTLDNNIS